MRNLLKNLYNGHLHEMLLIFMNFGILSMVVLKTTKFESQRKHQQNSMKSIGDNCNIERILSNLQLYDAVQRVSRFTIQ